MGRRFPSRRILVVGDIMLDEYVFGTVGRISPEAPVPVVAVTRETRVPGGAANVAFNLRGLGTGVEMAGLLGDDAGGRFVARMLKGKRVGTGAVVVDPDRPTTVKTRVIAHSQQVVRVDREQKAPPSRTACDALLRKRRHLQPDAPDYVEGAPRAQDGRRRVDRGRRRR